MSYEQPPQRPYGEAWITEQPPRRRRRVFPWVFLAVQVLFVIWVISAAASGGGIHADAVAYCHAHPSQYLPFGECVSDYGGGMKAGAGIGVFLIFVLWAAADVILGACYAAWRLARR
jgi:hypothetical protein